MEFDLLGCGKDESLRQEEPNLESSKLAFESINQAFHDYSDFVSTLDSKSAIVTAVDAGLLAFATSWNSTTLSSQLAPKWLLVAGLGFVILGLGASLGVVYVRPLYGFPGVTELWNNYKSKTREDTLDYLIEGFRKALESNKEVLEKKRKWANRAIWLSIIGFLLVGLSHILKIVLV
jgi:hypothetical protein